MDTYKKFTTDGRYELTMYGAKSKVERLIFNDEKLLSFIEPCVYAYKREGDKFYIYGSRGYTFLDLNKTYLFYFYNHEQTNIRFYFPEYSEKEFHDNYIYETYKVSEMNKVLTEKDIIIFEELLVEGADVKERIKKNYSTTDNPVIDPI